MSDRPREFWITEPKPAIGFMIGDCYIQKINGGIHVIEKSAYDALDTKLALICSECAGLKMVRDIALVQRDEAFADLKIAVEALKAYAKMESEINKAHAVNRIIDHINIPGCAQIVLDKIENFRQCPESGAV